jgi:hypothetical protein
VKLNGGDWRTIYQKVSGDVDFESGTSTSGTGISPDDLDCTVTGPGGTRPDVSRADGFTYQRNDDHYEAKLEFKASKSGEHVVRCATRDDPRRRLDLAVGPHFGTVGFVGRLIGFFAALFGGPLLGGLLALLVFLLRQRSKRRLQADVRASWPPPPGAGPPSDFMDAGR